jgi:hypothetical protein
VNRAVAGRPEVERSRDAGLLKSSRELSIYTLAVSRSACRIRADLYLMLGVLNVSQFA